MKVMILAAGRGERLRPLTDTLPKALVSVCQKPLIVHHIEKLAAAGFKDIVINLAHLGNQIQETLGDGQSFGLNITYSPESEGGLETGGGIFNALPLLGDNVFVTINADIFTHFDFNLLPPLSTLVSSSIPAHLVLVPNTKYHPSGDFSLKHHSHFISNEFPRPYIASGITIYHPCFFEGLAPGKYSVTPYWRKHAEQQKILGTVFEGVWHDIGTLEKLKELDLAECSPFSKGGTGRIY